MSYAQRNSLVLGILLVAALAFGLYWTGWRQVSEIDALRTAQGDAQGRLSDINAVLSVYDTTQAKLGRLKARSQERNQIIPAADTPSRTMAYLHELLRFPDASVSFDFLYKGRMDKGGYSVGMYALGGEGRLENLYAFIWHLEHGRRFYSVDHLWIEYTEPETGVHTAGWDWVDFKVIFRAYFEPQSRVEDLPASEDPTHPDAKAKNPFRPLITKTLPGNRLDLFEVTDARLKGLTSDLAYLEDRNHRMHLLREGDRVFLGKLSKIDIDRNRVEFVLDEGGIWRRVALEVEIDPSKK